MKIPSNEKLIAEEQQVLDKLIDVMDKVIDDKNHLLQCYINEAKYARDGNTDVICNLGVTQKKKMIQAKKLKKFKEVEMNYINVG